MEHCENHIAQPADSRCAFTLLGVDQVQDSLSVRIDFRAGQILKSDVGLEDSSYAPDLIAPDGQTFQLSIEGSSGTLNAETDHVRFTTTDTMPAIDIIYYFLTASDNENLFEILRAGVDAYGIDSNVVESKIDHIIADSSQKDNFALPVGSNLGFDVGYDLRYDGTKDVQVIIVTVSATS